MDEQAARPTGVVSFLFTDIEGSTRRWETNPDAMRETLSVHDALMWRVVAGHDGWLFKHTGDGVCTAFRSPRAAVDAAIAAQRSLELPVRMGIATGEAELRGDDYFGMVLNRAARIMSAGHGGQILLDGLTAELLSDVEVIDLGRRRLRDIAKAVPVFQVRAAELRTDFPPLRTAEPTCGNLRRETSKLVGRTAEIREVAVRLADHRLVTLTGVGGVGKTRLALEVASRCAADYPDGVFVIELAPVGDPSAVPDAVAAPLGIAQQPGLSLTDSVAAALEGRNRLLVFDNCEHVLDAVADMMEAILARSATVKILATSREGLRLPDEQLWPVPPLEVCSGAESAAAALFLERARAVTPDRALDGESDAVVEICRRLDGIPLGIELAASRMVSMTATEVRDRLDDRFRLLVGSRRALERHQTLRHAVQWSYDLLAPAERTLLNRCSVFAGGFDLTAACATAGMGDEFATIDILDALVRKSLLNADRRLGRTRYSMLETIRQFAADQLVQAGEADEARSAHARYFASWGPVILALWDSPSQREAYESFTAELANMRAAFRWAADRNDLDSAVTIASYATFIGLLIEQYEPVGWAETMVESAQSVEHPGLRMLLTMAAQCYWVGRIYDAVRYSERGLRLIGDQRFNGVPFGYGTLIGAVFVATGEPDRWVAACRSVLACEDDCHGNSRASLAMALSFSKGNIEALALMEDAMAVALATDNPYAMSHALLARGFTLRHTDPAAAVAALERTLEICAMSGNRFNESHAAVTVSQLEARHGDPSVALDHLQLAISNYIETGNIATSRSPLAILAALLDRLGHSEAAAVIADFAANPLTRLAFPEVTDTITHLRDALGEDRYESLARTGRAMSNSAMAAYASEQIDRARAELNNSSASP